ncbi:hypothetical protein BJY04DRAFT_220280 [Aspergillus karnatakaensis]|uniref:uncharacterized protein n=1 Tax=Aspergillus karnatakaensis TaxID=1810916 RepID=UPI003CCD1209
MPTSTIPDTSGKEKHPLTLPELTKGNLALLVEVLTTGRPQHTTPVYSKEASDHIQKLIKKLPSELRRRFSVLLFSSTFVADTTALCTVHRGLSPYIISDILRLLRLEVEDHLEEVERWSKAPLEPRVENALLCLRSLRGLWTDYTTTTGPRPNEKRRSYQQNKCEACIISQVITNPQYLEYLRAALQSRTRTRCKHRVPKLCRLVEQALGKFNIGTQQQIYKSSSGIGMALKQVRKDASREKHSHARSCKRVCMNPKSKSDGDVPGVNKSDSSGGSKTNTKGKRKSKSENDVVCDSTSNNHGEVTVNSKSKDNNNNINKSEPLPPREIRPYVNPPGGALPSPTSILERPRRPRSGTVMFCISPGVKRTLRAQEDYPDQSPAIEEDEDGDGYGNTKQDEDAAQDQLIYDIINAYNTCIPEDGEADLLSPDLPVISPLLNNPPQQGWHTSPVRELNIEPVEDLSDISRLLPGSETSGTSGPTLVATPALVPPAKEKEESIRQRSPVEEGSAGSGHLHPGSSGLIESITLSRSSSRRQEVCRVTVEVYSESDYSASNSVDGDEASAEWKRGSRDTTWSLLCEFEPKVNDSE